MRGRAHLKLAFVALAAVACGSSTPPKGGPFPGDVANFDYVLDGHTISLKQGTYVEKTGAGVDDFIATDLTNARLDADFDGDEATDAAVVVTHDEGPLKVHYLVVILQRADGHHAQTSVALGKNVLVENLANGANRSIEVTYLGHEEGVPEDAAPTTKMVKSFKIADGKLVAR